MSPWDFMKFRGALEGASGFQSVQFRVIENKFGVLKENRTRFCTNLENGGEHHNLNESMIKKPQRQKDEPSLFDLVEEWLERTPGVGEDSHYNFGVQFQNSVNVMISQMENNSEKLDDEDSSKEQLLKNIEVTKERFRQIFDDAYHATLVERKQNRMSRPALLGAIFINMYRDELRFHQASLFLQRLMDIDVLINKWRYNHVLMVQRMLGSNLGGTGGSSGYQYLRSTLSDKYKVFIDLFNLSSFMILPKYFPKLTTRMHRTLNSHNTSFSELSDDQRDT